MLTILETGGNVSVDVGRGEQLELGQVVECQPIGRSIDVGEHAQPLVLFEEEFLATVVTLHCKRH